MKREDLIGYLIWGASCAVISVLFVLGLTS